MTDNFRPLALLWLGFLGTAILWFVGFLYAWSLAEFGCQMQLANIKFLNISLIAWLEFMGRFLLLMTGYFLLRYVYHGILHKERLQETELAEDTVPVFLAKGGLIAGIFLMFVIVVESIPIFFFLKSC